MTESAFEFGLHLGRPLSREGRSTLMWTMGSGGRRVSIVAGAHADEPAGPATLEGLISENRMGSRDHFLSYADEFKFWIVPNCNPDGAERNRWWGSNLLAPAGRNRAADKEEFALAMTSPCAEVIAGEAPENPADYFENVVREGPGDDIEFGYPRNEIDREARPENLAIAEFLRGAGGPFDLHISLHGMGVATGVWCLLGREWSLRTRRLREAYAEYIAELGLPLHDVERHGDKGFHRLAPGFATTPTHIEMKSHFLARGDAATASLFRPSSMEFVRGLGGDPLTIVSEVPLYLIGDAPAGGSLAPGEVAALSEHFRARLAATRATATEARPAAWAALAREFNLRRVPRRAHRLLHYRLIELGLDTVRGKFAQRNSILLLD